MFVPVPVYVPPSCRRLPPPETPRSFAARLIRRRDVRTACEIAALGLFVGGLLAWSAIGGGL